MCTLPGTTADKLQQGKQKQTDLINSWPQANTLRVNNYKTGPPKR